MAASPRRRFRLVAWLAIAVVAVGLFVAWWWPALARDPQRLDVLVVGDGLVTQARDDLARRVRQSGESVDVVEASARTLCDARRDVDDLAGSRHPATIVLSFAELGTCAEPFDLATDARVVVLGQPPSTPTQAGTLATMAAFADANGYDFVDPTHLLGTSSKETRIGCQWWDTPGAGEDRPGLGKCQPDGQVTVWTGDSLTPAGSERFARALVGAL
jgi:hypothetical protein